MVSSTTEWLQEKPIFSQLKEEEPHILYYHLVGPKIEFEAQDEADILSCRTAIPAEAKTLTPSSVFHAPIHPLVRLLIVLRPQ